MPTITVYLTDEEKQWADNGDSRSGRIRSAIKAQMEREA